ncbi:hypothetical protein [Halalkalibacter alkalisediminis]|uniref:Uncharacterized protein n=1 Tax=Halalkalibacter alkalisediminis TaxID=935616 RepID=A0ABV6NII4_9BACI|nr:hypothetical protein [Halalkalibacter alkalisediminis]
MLLSTGAQAPFFSEKRMEEKDEKRAIQLQEANHQLVEIQSPSNRAALRD